MHRFSYVMGALSLAALLSGCGAAGAFHQVRTSDNCHGGDPDCSQRGIDGPLALGATISPEARVEIDGTAGPAAHYESAAPSIIEVVDGQIRGQAEGASALLFVSDANTVLDFIHVWVKKPTSLRLESKLPGTDKTGPVEGTVDLMVGDELWLHAEPIANGQPLLGDAKTEWQIDPPIVEALREGTENRRRLVAERPGNTVLKVRMLGVETTLDLIVHARLEPSAPAPRAQSKRGAS